MAEEVLNVADFSNEHDEHVYDGIKELDNPAPMWIYLLFFATIGFSLFYLIQNFGFPNNGKDQYSVYNKEVAAAAALKGSSNNSSNSAASAVVDPKQQLATGAKLFAEKTCIACHGAKGEGNAIGPNLTDKFWINGCKEADIIKMINNGKPEKGMTPFKGMMTEDQIKTLAYYILNGLVGSNPPNAKAAQGVECK